MKLDKQKLTGILDVVQEDFYSILHDKFPKAEVYQIAILLRDIVQIDFEAAILYENGEVVDSEALINQRRNK